MRHLNLTEWRSVLAEGARLAHDPRPRVVLARHVLDATSAIGRESFARLCSMAMRAEGGLLLADVHVAPDDDAPRDHAEGPDWMVGRVDLAALTRLLEQAGAARIKVRRLERHARPTVRLVGEWTHAAQGRTATVGDGGDGTPAGAAGR